RERDPRGPRSTRHPHRRRTRERDVDRCGERHLADLHRGRARGRRALDSGVRGDGGSREDPPRGPPRGRIRGQAPDQSALVLAPRGDRGSARGRREGRSRPRDPPRRARRKPRQEQLRRARRALRSGARRLRRGLRDGPRVQGSRALGRPRPLRGSPRRALEPRRADLPARSRGLWRLRRGDVSHQVVRRPDRTIANRECEMSEAIPPLAPLPTDLSQLQLTLDPKPTAYFGRGRVAETGEILTTLGARAVLVVTDPVLATSPIVARVRESRAAAGIRASVYSDVTANRTTDALDAGSDAAAAFQADAIVAVGGGSAMDAAKGIALGAVNPQRGLELDYATEFEQPALPIVAIPTTAGTGAEVTAFGVITDARGRRKFYVGHESTTARAAILDPELTVGLPPAATAATGMDALTHSVESYLSVRAN